MAAAAAVEILSLDRLSGLHALREREREQSSSRGSITLLVSYMPLARPKREPTSAS